MEIQQILDSIYILPVILEHLEKPSETTFKFLNKAGITEDDIAACRKIPKLLSYHKYFICNGTANYNLLRQGLDEYFREYLSQIWRELGMTNLQTSMLDYGCGDGSYSLQFVRDNPRSMAVSVDKNIPPFLVNRKIKTMEIDFEKDARWYRKFERNFGVVLLSEILHCKTDIVQRYLIRTSVEMLETGGHLVINENMDYAMEYRISKLKGSPRPVVTAAQIQALTELHPLKLVDIQTINNHHIFHYEKI